MKLRILGLLGLATCTLLATGPAQAGPTFVTNVSVHVQSTPSASSLPTQPMFNGQPVKAASLPTQPMFNGQPVGNLPGSSNPSYANNYYYGRGYGYGYGYSGGEASMTTSSLDSFQDAATATGNTSPPGYGMSTSPAQATPPSAYGAGAMPYSHATVQQQIIGHVLHVDSRTVVLRSRRGDVTLWGKPTPSNVHPGDLIVAWMLDDGRWTDLAVVK